MRLIGKVIATEKSPSSIDDFVFWTDIDLILRPFDVVKVDHIGESKTFAVIEEISHITDSGSFLSDFISNDFGDVNAEERTMRIGMNYVKAKVVGNSKDIYIPVQSNSKVYLASKDEVSQALGLQNVKNPLVCGYLEMYDDVVSSEKIQLPVNLDARFLLGPEGAHLNISGISGLASKTSYAMFLIKAIQDKYLSMGSGAPDDGGVAFVVFNVKGKDLLAIDEPNEFDEHDSNVENENERTTTENLYEMLGIDFKPFSNVNYFYPASSGRVLNSYAESNLKEKQTKKGQAFEYVFDYSKDKESLELLFANVDDSTQTMDSIITYVINGEDSFGQIDSWKVFLEELDKRKDKLGAKGKEISVQSWRKFTRMANKSIKGNPIFDSVREAHKRVRIADKLEGIKSNDIFVIDIAKLNTDMQAFVFGDTIRKIYDFQLGDNWDEDRKKPSKIVIFIDELNKFASTEVPKNSPIARQIIDIAERGRSLGVILFGAEQFRSAIHDRVKGNCSTAAYGRTNAIEIEKGDYRYIPKVYKGMMTRLTQGEYIIQNPILRSFLKVNFPRPVYKQFKN